MQSKISMKLYCFLFLIGLCATIGKVNAQSTGYMGKRVLLGYGFHTSPITFGSSANNTSLIGDGGSAETGVFALNMIHEGYLELAASSRWMISLSARYYKTTFDNTTSVNYTVYGNNSGYNDSYYGKPNGYYNITGLTYSLYFKYFGARYVAPWGRYIMFGPVMNTVKTTYDPAIMYLAQNSYSYNGAIKLKDFGPIEQNFKGFNIMFGWGRSRVFGNRVVIDYGCNLQLLSLLTTVFDNTSDDGLSFFESNEIDNLSYMERTNKRRVRGVNRFNVFLKIGVLLF